jgi:hypothetical protein
VISITPGLISLVTVGGVAATILLMFLPAIVELWKPKDAGPRLIAENYSVSPLTLNNLFLMATIEPVLADIETETGITKIYTKTLSFLFNLESFTIE